jgi:hypothetical protein
MYLVFGRDTSAQMQHQNIFAVQFASYMAVTAKLRQQNQSRKSASMVENQ